MKRDNLKATIIRYNGVRDIDVKFENGQIVYNKTYGHFKHGGVAIPVSRIGECRIMNNGLMATIIGYRNNKDIDIQFVESGLMSYHKYYICFKNGSIDAPMLLEEIDAHIVVSNINTKPITRFLIDKQDVSILGDKNWCIGCGGYISSKNNGKNCLLHRLIVNASADLQVDHINMNKLDNRRCNLRICTRSQNKYNTAAPSHNTSGFKGVLWRKNSNKWMARVSVNGKYISLGLYDDILDAARAYNEAALKYHGEFARLNEI